MACGVIVEVAFSGVIDLKKCALPRDGLGGGSGSMNGIVGADTGGMVVVVVPLFLLLELITTEGVGRHEDVISNGTRTVSEAGGDQVWALSNEIVHLEVPGTFLQRFQLSTTQFRRCRQLGKRGTHPTWL
jgi:hypothetical protein